MYVESYYEYRMLFSKLKTVHLIVICKIKYYGIRIDAYFYRLTITRYYICNDK